MEPITNESYQQELTEAIVGQTFDNIEWICVESDAWELVEGETWIVNGAVQMTIGGKKWTFSFVTDDGFIDLKKGDTADYLKDVALSRVPGEQWERIKALFGLKITEIEWEWNWYEDAEGNAGFMPLEIVLSFDNEEWLQLAAFDYAMTEDAIGDFSFDSQGDILISLDRYAIAMPGEPDPFLED